MKTSAKQATVIEALNALYGGTGRSGRLGVISTDGGVGKQEVEWADVEGWWSVWASRLCAKNPGIERPFSTTDAPLGARSSGIVHGVRCNAAGMPPGY